MAHGPGLKRELGLLWAERQKQRPPKEPSECYSCGSKEHLARDCPLSVCHFCGRTGHLARACQFGQTLQIGDQFILCEDERCCVRRFLMPLHQAPLDFEDITTGRVDVGCRSVTACLFRSESYRRNSEIRLTFSAGDAKVAWEKQVDVERGTTAVLTGGLVRGLRPDEASVAMRLRAALSANQRTAGQSGRLELGLRSVAGGLRGSLQDCFAHDVETVLLLLDPDGLDLEDVAKTLGRREPPIRQLLVLLGDDKGLAPEELQEVMNFSAEVHRISLGPDMLLGSHCIVLVHHYLDRYLHTCPTKLFEVPAEAQLL
ncbi:unnamed protein product [Durusdinium trenchii]|uniref:CCHC-type domain-containing protein n=1 Tax=Durusdinium trenchii TaxID=1381693 RepID=A0ABP0HM33_9DINO